MQAERPHPLPHTAWLHERLLVGIVARELTPAETCALMRTEVDVIATVEFTRASLDALGPIDEEETLPKPVNFQSFPLRFDEVGRPDPSKLSLVLRWLGETVEAGTTIYLHPSTDASRIALVAGLHFVAHTGMSAAMARRNLAEAFGRNSFSRSQTAFFDQQADAILSAFHAPFAKPTDTEAAIQEAARIEAECSSGPYAWVRARAFQRHQETVVNGTPTGEFVVGVRDDGFCSLLPLEGEEFADDQCLWAARKFDTFESAARVARRTFNHVFAVIREGVEERIEEVE